MARKQRDIVEYFPHDSRASEGDTLTILQARYGNDGYAFWFKLLEKLSATEGHYIDCNDNIKWEILCSKANTTVEIGISIMNSLVELKAIDPELWRSRIIWCQNLVDNVADVYKNRRRNTPNKPIITTTNEITTPTLTDKAITTGQSTQSKVEESKVNKSKVEKKNESSSSSIEIDEKFKRAVKAYENCFGKPVGSLYNKQTLEEFIVEYSIDWIEDAFREASKSTNTPNMKYIQTILERWLREGRNNGKRNKTNEPIKPGEEWILGIAEGPET